VRLRIASRVRSFLETVKARYEDHNHRDNITVCVALL
jgi:hypothetical protein